MPKDFKVQDMREALEQVYMPEEKQKLTEDEFFLNILFEQFSNGEITEDELWETAEEHLGEQKLDEIPIVPAAVAGARLGQMAYKAYKASKRAQKAAKIGKKALAVTTAADLATDPDIGLGAKTAKAPTRKKKTNEEYINDLLESYEGSEITAEQFWEAVEDIDEEILNEFIGKLIRKGKDRLKKLLSKKPQPANTNVPPKGTPIPKDRNQPISQTPGLSKADKKQLTRNTPIAQRKSTKTAAKTAATGAAATATMAPKPAEAPQKKEPPKVTAPAPKPTKAPEKKGQSFGAAFRAARKAHGGPGGVFTWRGKKYQTNIKGEPYVKKPKPVKVKEHHFHSQQVNDDSLVESINQVKFNQEFANNLIEQYLEDEITAEQFWEIVENAEIEIIEQEIPKGRVGMAKALLKKLFGKKPKMPKPANTNVPPTPPKSSKIKDRIKKEITPQQVTQRPIMKKIKTGAKIATGLGTAGTIGYGVKEYQKGKKAVTKAVDDSIEKSGIKKGTVPDIKKRDNKPIKSMDDARKALQRSLERSKKRRDESNKLNQEFDPKKTATGGKPAKVEINPKTKERD